MCDCCLCRHLTRVWRLLLVTSRCINRHWGSCSVPCQILSWRRIYFVWVACVYLAHSWEHRLGSRRWQAVCLCGFLKVTWLCFSTCDASEEWASAFPSLEDLFLVVSWFCSAHRGSESPNLFWKCCCGGSCTQGSHADCLFVSLRGRRFTSAVRTFAWTKTICQCPQSPIITVRFI